MEFHHAGDHVTFNKNFLGICESCELLLLRQLNAPKFEQDAIRPPTLLALALPHLPQPIPKIITHVLKYIQMGSLFLNDVAALLFGMGVLIYYSSWRV